MKELKFRAWDFLEKTMIDISHWTINMLNENRAPIMQFTGLKDKNGKEIYEGDIIVNKTNKTGASYRVIFESGGFTFEANNDFSGVGKRCNRRFWPADFARPENWEVIGNLYQNPELLEREKK